MTNSVANVVRERPDSKRKLIGGMSIVQKTQHKVAGTNVVSQVREERVAERIVSKVLDGAATVRISMRLLQLRLSKRRILLQQNGPNRLLPRQVDQLFMGLHRVRNTWSRAKHQSNSSYRFEQRRSSKGVNRVSLFVRASVLHTVQSVSGDGKWHIPSSTIEMIADTPSVALLILRRSSR